jgi:ABC-2 type transport system permease protein
MSTTVNALAIALATEARKAAAARVFRSISVMLVAGTAALTIGMVLGLRSGNEEIIARLAPYGSHEGWPLLLSIVDQIAAAGGLVAFAVALSWIVGREFADGTISGLFGLPVGRGAIASAKLAVFVVWGSATGAALVLAIYIVGLALGYGLPDADALASLGRIVVLVSLSTLIAVPVAWIATLGRGLLAGIAAGVGIVVIAQFSVVTGAGAWMPLAAPALWAMSPESVAPAQLALVLVVPLLFWPATVLTWRRLQLDR